MKCVIYCRISTEDKNDSLNNQETVCREFAESQNWQIFKVLKESSKGVSGIDPNPPQLKKALEIADSYDILLTRDLTRFSRDVEKAYFFKFQFRLAGVKVYIVDGDNTESDFSELSNMFQFGFASWERKQISKRMHTSKRLKVKKGKFTTAKNPPFGYNESGQIEQKEAEIIRIIFDLYVNQNMSINAIATFLNDKHVPTCNMIRGKSKSGRWYSSLIRQYLRNETYIGKWTFGKWSEKIYHDESGKRIRQKIKNFPDKHIVVDVPPIIPEDVFNKAQSKLDKNRKFRKQSGNHLLARRITCHCGRKMIATNQGSYKSGAYFVYRCTNKSNNAKTPCSQKSLKSEPIDKLVYDWLVSQISETSVDEKIRRILKSLAEEIETLLTSYELLKSRLKDKQKEHDQIVDYQKRYATEFEAQSVQSDKVQLQEELKKLKSDIFELELEINDLIAEYNHLESLTKPEKIAEDWEVREELESEGYSVQSPPLEYERQELESESFQDKLALIKRYGVECELLASGEIKVKCNLLGLNGVGIRNYLQLTEVLRFSSTI